jgi:hypothetical protein
MKKYFVPSAVIGMTALTLCGCAVTCCRDKQTHASTPASGTAHMQSSHDIPGYKTFLEDGRLWVFEEGSEDLAKFIEHGEPAKIVVLPGKGPGGMTLKGTERDVMLAYAFSKPGFRVFLEDGRLWVFEEGSEDLAKFIEHGEPAKIVVLPGKGPGGMTVKSVDRSVIDAYLAAK